MDAEDGSHYVASILSGTLQLFQLHVKRNNAETSSSLLLASQLHNKLPLTYQVYELSKYHHGGYKSHHCDKYLWWRI